MTTPLRRVVVLAFVMAGAAVCLRALDSVPRLLTGLPRGVISFDSFDDLRRRAGTEVLVPSYVPATLEWPPREITLYRGQEVAFTVPDRVTGTPWMTIVTTPLRRGEFSAAMLTPATVLQTSEATVGGADSRVERVQDRTGAIWHQVVWPHAGRVVLLRYRGPVEELLGIAGSLRARTRP